MRFLKCSFVGKLLKTSSNTITRLISGMSLWMKRSGSSRVTITLSNTGLIHLQVTIKKTYRRVSSNVLSNENPLTYCTTFQTRWSGFPGASLITKFNLEKMVGLSFSIQKRGILKPCSCGIMFPGCWSKKFLL
jgi:hypothetical protein